MFAEPMNLRAMGQKPSPPEAARMHLAASQDSEEVAQQHTGSMSGTLSALAAVTMSGRKAHHRSLVMSAGSQTAASALPLQPRHLVQPQCQVLPRHLVQPQPSSVPSSVQAVSVLTVLTEFHADPL